MKEVIAIDLGGTHLRFAHVKNNKIQHFIRKETPKTRKAILEEITKYISEHKNVSGIGIACAGIINDGTIKSSPNLPFDNFNLKAYLNSTCKKRVEVENDANCVALAEAKLGVKRKNFFVLTLGTGIGGGIIINGELYKGRGSAGELGNLILSEGKTFEYLAAKQAIIKLIKKHYKVKSVPEMLMRKVLHEKSNKSEKIRNEIADYIGQGIASLVHILDPEIIVLDGGMKKIGNPFLSKIKAYSKKHASKLLIKIPEIKWSSLEHSGLRGAGLLVN